MTNSPESVKNTVAYSWKPAAIVAGLVAISTIAFNVTAIRQYFDLNSANLVASVSANNFKMPPSFWDQLAISSTEDAGLVTNYSLLDSITTVSIRNAGNLPAKDVRLKLETGGLAIIKWDKEESETIEFETTLPIGNLAIEKSAEVTIWTASTPLTLTVLHSMGNEVLPLYREALPPLWFWGFMIGLPLIVVALSYREKANEAKIAKAEVLRLREQEFARQQVDFDERNAQFQNEKDALNQELRKSLARIKLCFTNKPATSHRNSQNLTRSASLRSS
jgi:hypothetical protein